jgi:hypothetical protein
LKLTGSRLYAVSNRSLIGVSLLNGPAVPFYVGQGTNLLPDTAMLSRQYLIVPATNAATVAEEATTFQLACYSRELGTSSDGKLTESGRLAHLATVSETAHILAWYAVDGGVYYLSGDNKLHWLAGAAK